MSDTEWLERALEERLDREHGSGGLGARPRPDAAAAEAVAPLVDLAAYLAVLGAACGPAPEFRVRLAADLAAAPAPRTLAAPAAVQPAAPASVVAAAAQVAQVAPRVASAPTHAGAPTDALVQALDRCLAAVGQQGIDPAVALAGFPDLADELRPLLALAVDLDGLEAVESPSTSYRARLAAYLASAPRPRSLAAPVPRGVSVLRRLWRSTAFTAAAAATVVLFLGAGAIYASADARPGDWLYPFKRGSEQARLWFAPAERALWIHLGYADRRLDEAVGARSHAGLMLADFSREVTAALGVADEALADGAPRQRVVDPLLGWLIDARGRLVTGRPSLPPTAWRGSLALVDEAIRALRSGQLAVAPVPRLSAPVILARAVAPVSRVPADRLAAGRMRRVATPDSWAIGSGATAETSGSPGGRPAETVYRIVTASAPSSAPSGGPVGAGANGPGAELGGVPGGVPPTDPTSPAPPRDRPRSSPAVPTATPPGVSEPTPREPVPSAPPPSAPPSPAVTETAWPDPTATGVPPTAPPVPTATAAPVFHKAPVITQVTCDDTRLMLGKSTMCHVTAYDPEGAPLAYLWTSDVQMMLNERQKDATYYAAWSVGGGVMTVRITVYVSDSGEIDDPSTPGLTSAETFVEVRPPDAQNR